MSDQSSERAAAAALLDDVLKKGVAFAEAGDSASAEPLFRQAVALAPRDPGLLFNLGVTLSNLKKLDEAERVLIEAINVGAGANARIVLGELYEAQDRHADAVKCFEELLEFDHRKYSLLLKIGDLQGLMGDDVAQRANYRRAMEVKPGDAGAILRLANATLKFVDKAWKTDLDAAVRAEEEMLPLLQEHPKARMPILRQLVMHKEWSERIRRGEAPYHASNINELFFRYASAHLEDLNRTSEQARALKPKDLDALVSLTLARFCLGDRHGAEAIANSIPDTVAGGLWETAKFGPEFYDELRGYSDEDLVRDLPPLLDVATMSGDPKGILYLSCNFTYFVAFALPMVMSLRDRSPATPVHLHIMDPPPEHTAFIAALMRRLSPLPFAISIERPGLQQAKPMEARCYYHAVRFIRLYTHLKKYQSPLWLMDVDAIVNRGLGSLFDRLPGHDVAVRVRPARLEPWNQFNACMVGANTTPRSLDYFRDIAAYIAYFYRRKSLRWGIDQLAMYGVFADMQDRGTAPSLALLGERDVDYDQDDDGYVWPNSGGGKLSHMDRLHTPGAPPAAPPTTKFDIIFERYWQESVQAASAVGVKL